MSYRYLGVIALLLLLAACTSPVAPTSPHPTMTRQVTAAAYGTVVPLIILTYERGTEYPLQTLVTYDNGESTWTDASGYVVIKAPLHAESVVRVERDGYGPMEAAAVLESAERWSFYLERLP